MSQPIIADQSQSSGQVDGRLLCRTLTAMILSRTLEAKLSSLYKAGKIVGGVYLGTGQEAFSASLGCSLDQEKDIFAPLLTMSNEERKDYLTRYFTSPFLNDLKKTTRIEFGFYFRFQVKFPIGS